MLPHMTLENMMGFYGSQDDMGLELQGWLGLDGTLYYHYCACN